MPSQTRTEVRETGMLTLTKQEIDRRIDHLVRQVAAGEHESSRPRRIEAADLVRRMRPFLVYN